MPKASIVIPVFNHAALTRQCLEALFATLGEDCEVIVVDDASTDDTRSALKDYRQQIQVVTHAQNAGFAISCNDGAAVARGDYLVFLNNDTIPVKGWLEAIVAYAAAHPRAAVVGAKLLFPNDTIQHAGMVFRAELYPTHIYLGFPADHPAVNKSRRFQIVTGACLLVPRSRFEELGRFDAAFVNGHEDIDFCLRAGASGYEVHYCHTSVLYHLESATRENHSAREARNMKLYLERWGYSIKPDEFTYYAEDGLLKASHHLQYPVELTVSPELATIAQWEEPDLVAHILHRRAGQVFDLLREKIVSDVRIKDLESRLENHENPVDVQVANLEKRLEEKEAKIRELSARLDTLKSLSANVHARLLQKDLNDAQDESAVRLAALAGFLDQLEAAADKLYRSSRWRWSNPVRMIKDFFRGPRTPVAGYWRIDEVLGAYRDWKCLQPGGETMLVLEKIARPDARVDAQPNNGATAGVRSQNLRA